MKSFFQNLLQHDFFTINSTFIYMYVICKTSGQYQTMDVRSHVAVAAWRDWLICEPCHWESWWPATLSSPSCVCSGTRSWSACQSSPMMTSVHPASSVTGIYCTCIPSPAPASAVCCTSVALAFASWSWVLDIHIQSYNRDLDPHSIQYSN